MPIMNYLCSNTEHMSLILDKVLLCPHREAPEDRRNCRLVYT
jgi:hypothetical protein